MKELLKLNSLTINIVVFVLFWVITFPAFSALLSPGMITGHDTEGHLVRLMEFDAALKDGHFPVRWSKRLDFGLGYPFFNFNYPLVYYLGSAIHRLGFDYVSALKIIFLLSFPLSGFFTYLWLKQYFKHLSAFLGGAFYTLIPYHFLNVYVRGALGEIVALTLVPLVFYFIGRLFFRPNLVNCSLLALSYAAVALSHNISAMVFSVIWAAFGVWQFYLTRAKKALALMFVSFLWGIALAAFFLIPALVYKQLTNIDFLITRFIADNFAPLKSYIYSPWSYGGFKVGIERGEMSVQIGLLHELIVLVAAAILLLSIRKWRKDINLKLLTFFMALAIFVFFLMQEVSLPLWKIISPMQLVEFPWRLLSVITVATAFISAYFFHFLQNKSRNRILPVIIFVSLVAALLFVNRNHWRANEYYTWIDYWKSAGGYFGTTTMAAEHIPKWHSAKEQVLPYTQSRVATGSADVQDLLWKTNIHEYRVKVESPAVIVDRTDYFPGWTVFANGEEISLLSPDNQLSGGLIAFPLSPGEYKVEVKLLETKLEKMSDAVSVLALALLGGVFVRQVSMRRRK